MPRKTDEELRQMKAQLFEDIQTGRIDIADATRMMRKVLRMTRRDYAEKIVKLSFETLQAIETRKANPTLKTLEALGKPFGLKVGFVVPEERNTFARQ